jgi:hypothetical protein
MRELRTRLRLAWAALQGHAIIAHVDANVHTIRFKRKIMCMGGAELRFDTPIRFEDGTNIQGV